MVSEGEDAVLSEKMVASGDAVAVKDTVTGKDAVAVEETVAGEMMEDGAKDRGCIGNV